MYVCPTCNNLFKNEESITKHFLKCWRIHNPECKSQPAPCKGNITKREVNEDVANFFASFRKE